MLVQVAEQDYEKEKLSERIAKLSGGVAVIQACFIFLWLSVIIISFKWKKNFFGEFFI